MIADKDYLKSEVVNTSAQSETPFIVHEDLVLKLEELAKDGFPDEIVGFIFGTENTALEIFPVTNIAENKTRRFEISPLDYMKAERTALAGGMDVLGIYHSHPKYPPIPSPTDLSFAQEGFSYPIISVAEDGIIKIRSWRISKGRFVEEPLIIKEKNK